MSSIAHVVVEGFRGIRQPLTLAMNGQKLLLRGDNGTGKSSLVQALRWALTGSPSRAGVKDMPVELIRHRLVNEPEKCSVKIALKNGGTIEMRGNGNRSDAAGQSFRDACVRANPFLQRDELVEILTASPGDRYKYLERFLDLEQVEATLEDLKTEVAAQVRRADRARSNAVRLLNSAGKQLLDVVTPASFQELAVAIGAEAKRLELLADEAPTWDAVAALIPALPTDMPSERAQKRRHEILALQSRVDNLVVPDRPQDALQAAAAAEASAQEGSLTGLLEEAQRVIAHRSELDACPLCEQAVDHRALLERLRVRLALMADVAATADVAESLGNAWADFCAALTALETETGVPATMAGFSGTRGVAALRAINDAHGVRVGEVVLRALDALRTAVVKKLEIYPELGRAVDLSALALCARMAAETREEILSSEAEFTKASRLLNRLETFRKALSKARSEVAQELLDRIGTNLTGYYSRIHPEVAGDEATGAPTLKVTRGRSVLAYVQGSLVGQPVENPQHAYSDGHLDTIGICIFLALRRSRADSDPNDPKIMVLDDIVLSVDMGHARRLVELLRDEFNDHQLMVMSHNQAFMRMCQEPLHEAKKVNIVSWSIDRGPALQDHVGSASRLRRALEECGTARELAGFVVPVIDEFAHAACNALRAAVPDSTHQPATLGDQWPALRSRVTGQEWTSARGCG